MKTLLPASIDWEGMFVPTTSLPEILIRGTLIYWFSFLCIRFFRRGAGQLSISDLLLITLIADASQNGMAGDYKSVTEGFLLIGVLLFWSFLLNWLGFRSPFFAKLTSPAPVLLIRNGVLLRQNMKKELITPDELMGMLREQGVDTPEAVKICYIEGDGNISVVTH